MLDDLILAGRTIAAIKAHREATGVSLSAARAAIEQRAATLRAAGRQPLPRRLTFGEWIRVVFIFGIIGVVLCALLVFVIVMGMALAQAIVNPHASR